MTTPCAARGASTLKNRRRAEEIEEIPMQREEFQIVPTVPGNCLALFMRRKNKKVLPSNE
jgi:hypothetical protein